MVKVIEPSGQSWQSAEKSNLCIEYKDWSGKSRNYYADFLVGNILVECKPKKLHSTKTVQLKREAAVEFCRNNGYRYLLTDYDRLTDDEICQLRSQGDLRFTDKYENKFKERTQ